ncbi:MAG: M56 family metallopeptidase [Candidatus Eremiobacteraeota bacterium]|nr:M56 family metallopeptidase [Candidatus Eremiobacteraeota bacterium]
MSAAGLLMAALNAIWQSALLCALAAVGLALARANAATRAAVWTVVFVAAAVLTPLDLFFAPAVSHGPSAPTAAAQLPAHTHLVAAERFAAVLPALHGARDHSATVASGLAQRCALPGLIVWCFLTTFFLLRVARATLATLQLKKFASPLEGCEFATSLQAMASAVRQTRVGLSDLIDMPCAVGLRRPMVLLPRALFERLEAEDAYAVVAHEVAHLRRRDDVVLLLQQIGAALFFFNPFLRIASRRVDFYRELACDDHVITTRASALRYAQCLATILERALFHRRSFAPAFLQGRTQVFARVERLVNWKEGSRSMGRVAILITLAVCVTAAFFIRVELPLLGSGAVPHQDRETAFAAAAHNLDDDTLLGALAAAGYRITPDDAIALANAGVDSDLIVAIHRSGIERPSKTEIIEMADAGVDGDLIAAAARAFGAAVSASDLVRLQNSGVCGDDLADITSQGVSNLSVSDVIALHEAGVDGDYIRHVTAATHGKLTASDVIRLHEAGVDS